MFRKFCETSQMLSDSTKRLFEKFDSNHVLKINDEGTIKQRRKGFINPFYANVHFYTTLNFSGGIEMEHWREMGQTARKSQQAMFFVSNPDTIPEASSRGYTTQKSSEILTLRGLEHLSKSTFLKERFFNLAAINNYN